MDNGIGTQEINRCGFAAVRTRSFRWALLAAALAGCQPASSPDADPDPESAPTAVIAPADFATWPRMTERPIPVQAGLWMLCRPLTPDEAKQAAEERNRLGPHFHSIMVRVSPDGATAYRENRALPVGAVVVKEKYSGRWRADSLRAYAVMTKRRNESAARGGGWDYAYVDLRPERAVASDRLNHCAECHASARSRDFLFRARGRPAAR